jgi:hypothetical protein
MHTDCFSWSGLQRRPPKPFGLIAAAADFSEETKAAKPCGQMTGHMTAPVDIELALSLWSMHLLFIPHCICVDN